MNWIALLIYLVIGFISAIIFLFLNTKIDLAYSEDKYIWGVFVVIIWPLFVLIGTFTLIGCLIALPLKWIDKNFIRRNKS